MTDIDETEVCFICGVQHDCSEGNEEPALGDEWVCLACQEAGKVQEYLDNEDK